MPTLPALKDTDWVEFLIQRKFPPAPSPMALKYGGNGHFGLQTALTTKQVLPTEVEAYRKTLLKLSPNDLDALVKQEQMALQAEQKELQRQMQEREENERPFNCGEALEPDYAYWAKMGTWEWDEATALSLGRNPLVVKPKLLDDYRYQHSPFVKEYAKRRELIRRSALWAGTVVTSPADFHEWAQKYQIELPADLVKMLEVFANPADWKKAYVGLNAQKDKLEQEVKDLEAKLAAKPSKAEKELSTTERNTLLKILYSMAKVEYGYNPDVRSTAASDIEKAVNAVGLKIDVDTVRTWLQRSAEYCREQGAE